MHISDFLSLASIVLLIVASLLCVVVLVRDKFLVESPFSTAAWIIYFLVLACFCVTLSLSSNLIERVFEGCM